MNTKPDYDCINDNTQSLPSFSENIMTFFHGGRHIFSEVLPENPIGDAVRDFGGIFAVHSDEGRPTHDFKYYGEHLYKITLRADEVCSYIGLEHRDQAAAFIRKKLREHELDEDDFDAAWSVVVNEESTLYLSDEELERLVCWLNIGDSIDEISALVAWGAQKARLELALALGYKAVQISDECSGTHLIGPGVTVEHLPD
jgi:hypothetical protein